MVAPLASKGYSQSEKGGDEEEAMGARETKEIRELPNKGKAIKGGAQRRQLIVGENKQITKQPRKDIGTKRTNKTSPSRKRDEKWC